ncbi:MAG: IPT/TIG domain-containing protein [Longimicrobiales bacterium]
MPPVTINSVSPALGPLTGGTRLYIVGTNFVNVTSVTVGGLELTNFAVINQEEMAGITPASSSAGPKDVVVVSSTNGTTRCRGCFTYVVPPVTLTVTSVSPEGGPRAGGTRVTITGTNFNNVTRVVIGTGELVDRTVVSATQITGITPAVAGAGAGDVAVVSSSNGEARCNGCFRYEPDDTAALVLAPSHVTINAGEQARAVLSLPRLSGSEGPVTFQVVDAPNGVRLSFHGETGIRGHFLMAVVADQYVAPGSYRVAIRVQVAGWEELTTTMTLTIVSSAMVGNTTVRLCGQRPFFVAYQDGDGSWTRATGAGSGYAFNLLSGRGALAIVEGNFTRSINTYAVTNTRLYYGTQAELNELFPGCAPSTTLGSIQVAVANAPTSVRLAWGTWGTTTASSSTSVNLPWLNPPADLVASYQSGWEGVGAGVSGKAIIRRNPNPAFGSTLPVLDFNAAEAFPLVSRRVNIAGGELHSVWSEFRTSNGTTAILYCVDPYNYGWCNPSSTFLGVPAPQAGDVHRLVATASDHWVMACFVQAVDQTLVFSPLGSVENSTVATSPSVRYRARYTRQAEYNGGVQITYTSTQPNTLNPDRSIELNVSAAYLGPASTVDLTIPDLSTVTGWDNDWGLKGTASLRFETRGWTETASGSGCGGPVDPFGRMQRAQASSLRAAWNVRTVAPAGMSGPAQKR